MKAAELCRTAACTADAVMQPRDFERLKHDQLLIDPVKGKEDKVGAALPRHGPAKLQGQVVKGGKHMLRAQRQGNMVHRSLGTMRRHSETSQTDLC